MPVSPSPDTLTVAAIGERGLIARIRDRAGAAPAGTVVGIGDDGAVLESVRGCHEVLTTDSLVEDVHFRRLWTPPRRIGRKAVAVNLSDLAAMGATPRAVLLDLCLPAAWTLDAFDALIDGVVEEARAAGAGLVGGNLAQSPGPLVVTVTAAGVVHRRRTLTRSGGRPGDELYLTGSIGGAAAGLQMRAAGLDADTAPAGEADCLDRYELPQARVRCGRVVAAHRAASACIDLSDGLAVAARQLAEASRTGVAIEGAALPVHDGARAWWRRTQPGADAAALALQGGEDYELLFAVTPRRRRAFLAAVARGGPVPVARIGRLTLEPDMVVRWAESVQPLPSGFAHLSVRPHQSG